MIYFDSAATSFQKPREVSRAVSCAMQNLSSPGRGGYESAMKAADLVLDCRIELANLFSLSKPERVRETIRETLGRISKREIMEKCPDISEITIKRVLMDLTASGTIIKVGSGRGTSYIYNRERE